MNYNINRIARLYDNVYSTKPNSPERTAALARLFESDQEALFDFDMGIRSGRITKPKNYEQEENGSMTYEQYKNKIGSDKSGTMQEVSQFAMKSPELYRQYKERYDKEQDEERALHNRRLTENTFKNKPYSFR
ncbi:MAG: hypothetical protein K2O91_02980 [Lachnospiraceae bacterium]|nr:hypothetical protein [Lachnospiraceae bacterium]